MNKIVNLFLLFALAGICGVLGWWVFGCDDGYCSFGLQQSLGPVQDFTECAARGFATQESHPRRCQAGSQVFVEKIIPSPIISPVTDANIKVLEPKPHQQIVQPITVKGQARVFENTLQVRVLDSQGNILQEKTGTALSPDIGQFGPFTVVLDQVKSITATGSIEVFVYSARDGAPAEVVSIPVRF